MLSWIKKILGGWWADEREGRPSRQRQEASGASADAQVYRDDALNQWMNRDSGELFPGFPIAKEDIVLDIGCGDGNFANFCASRGADIVLADIDTRRLQQADNLVKSSTSKVLSLVTDSNPLPLLDESITKVIAMEVMEHVDHPSKFLKELFRVGVPGALYFITVPDAVAENLQKPIAPASYYQKPNHIHVFDRTALVLLVESSGLVIEQECPFGFYWSLWWMFFWACKQDLSPPWHPILDGWRNVWTMVLETPQGPLIKKSLDECLPKSRMIIARKPNRK